MKNQTFIFFSLLLLLWGGISSCSSTPPPEEIPLGPVQHFKRGNENMRSLEFKEAIQEYNIAIQLDPQQEIFYYNRGLAEYSLKLYEQSIQSYQEAIRRNARLPEAWYNLALAYDKIGNTIQAFIAYDKYQELNR